MTLGVANNQGDLLDDVARFCDEALPKKSIYSFLRRERDRLFADHEFADLFERSGRRSVPPSVVAVVMVLQRLEGLSDREAVERYCFDNRWRYAAGVGGYDTNGWVSFSHTVLVDMRERLRNSTRPDRIFAAALGAAHEAGLVGRKRVLDSTPLYDAVATMDTITLIRSAIRGLLKVACDETAAQLRDVLSSGDDYASSAKPAIDWDDPEAQAELIDSRAKDAYACLALLDGVELDDEVKESLTLLATVVGQDLEEVEGTLRIARRVAKDRVISTVDPQARHGHKTSAHSFDGWKAHVAIDPDSEIITKTTVTAGNVGDASVVQELIEDLLATTSNESESPNEIVSESESESPREQERGTLYGDAAYGTGAVQSRLHDANIDSKCKTQPPSAKGGLFAKDRFTIDLENDTVVCPGEVTARIRRLQDGTGVAKFGEHCSSCPLAAQCTTSGLGRMVRVGLNEASLARARAEQTDPAWRDDYRATRPKIERKLAHLMRRRHGGRRARVRGTIRVDADFTLLAAAANLARLAVLGVQSTPRGWQLAGA
jgi:IS5 family transposase/transposase